MDAFPLFLQKVVDIIVLKLSIIFCRFIRLGLFPEGTPTPDRENYQPISITTILSKVYEYMIYVYGLLPAAQFA